MARTPSSVKQHDWNDESWTTGTPTTATETLSDTNWHKTDGLDCSDYHYVQITWDINFAGSTDDVVVGFFASADGTNYDDTYMDYVLTDNTTDPEQKTIMIWPAPKYLQIGFQNSGTTDSHVVSFVKVIGFY